MEIEKILRKRIEKEVVAEINNWAKETYRVLTPENQTIYIDLSRFKNLGHIGLVHLMNEIIKQRTPALYEHRGNKEVKEFVAKIDAMRGQIDELYEGLET